MFTRSEIQQRLDQIEARLAILESKQGEPGHTFPIELLEEQWLSRLEQRLDRLEAQLEIV